MRVTFIDLLSHTDYFVEARSKFHNVDVSFWSPLFHFVTDKDTIPPAPVTNVSVTALGRGFRVLWTIPTTDAAGNVLADLSHFEVTVTDGVSFGTYKVLGNSFDFNYDMNVSLFGSPKGTLDFSIVGVDKSENKSTAATASGLNEPPADVTGLVASAGTDEIRLTWNAISAEDFSSYVVFTNDVNDFSTAVEAVNTANAFLDYQTSLYDVDHYFWVKAIDLFGSYSAGPSNVQGPLRPNTVFTLDTAPPPIPTGLVVTPGVNSLTVQWETPVGSDAVRHTIRYRSGANSPWLYQAAGTPDGTNEQWPVIKELIPGATYTVEVQAHDGLFNESDWLTGTGVPLSDPTAPGLIAGLFGTASATRIAVAWNRVPTADKYEAVLSTDVGRTTGVVSKIDDATVAIFNGLTTGSTYWVSVRALSGTTPPVASDWTQIGPATLATTTSTFGSIDPELHGSMLIENTVRAETLQADSTITHNLSVGARLTMGTGLNGEIVSGNYYNSGTTTPSGSGYRLTSSNLDLRTGTINAGMITVGAMQSSATITEGESGQPAWYINTAGAAEFGDARVRGRIVVGNTSNTSAVNSTISVRSADYSPGQAGWSIAGNGNVEFNDGTFRGSLAAGGTVTSPALYVDKANGNLLVGSVNTSGGTANFKVTGSTGAVSIGGSGSLTVGSNFGVTSAGYLTSTSGLIGGWYIYNGYLQSGQMTLSGSSGITMGSTFSVSSTGYMSATNGQIAGFTFNGSTLSGSTSSYISGGNITGVNISASSFSTADSGKRIVLTTGSLSNILYFYDDIGSSPASVSSMGTGVRLNSTGGSSRIDVTQQIGIGIWTNSDITMSSTYTRVRNANNGSFSDITVPYSGVIAVNGSILSFSHDHPYASSGHDHSTSSGSTIVTLNNRFSYVFPPQTHNHGTFTSSQPNWTGGGTNTYDTGDARPWGTSGPSTGTAHTHNHPHVHTSTSHTHTVTI